MFSIAIITHFKTQTDAEISEVRDEMLENIDFVFVPLECWSYLVKKYGTSSENTAIKRQVCRGTLQGS